MGTPIEEGVDIRILFVGEEATEAVVSPDGFVDERAQWSQVLTRCSLLRCPLVAISLFGTRSSVRGVGYSGSGRKPSTGPRTYLPLKWVPCPPEPMSMPVAPER